MGIRVEFIIVFAIFGKVLTNILLTDKIVKLPNLGKIQGYMKTSENGSMFYAFEGVPYANPPIGENRFREPLPLQPWDHIWQANTVFRCMQYRHLTFDDKISHPIVGTEDCLYLNIYTPTLDENANLDVIVFIHGGAFMFNYGAFQKPDFLLNRQVLYVNLNYRLGPLGFLSTEDDVVPGNNGLKDQIAAFQWIQKNIKYFGGNPKSVTITGNSAGGASVQFHYLIPQSKDLFQRGISQSGSVLNPWVLMENPLHKTRRMAYLLGCTTSNSTVMIDCMRQVHPWQILQTIKAFQPWLYNPISPFSVVVDKWSSKPLLKEHPYKLLEKGMVLDVPWIISHTKSEGLYPGAEFYYLDLLKHINEKWNEVIPHILMYNTTVDSDKRDYVSEQIRNFYFGDKIVSRDTFSQLIQAIGDRLFVADINKAVKLHAAAVSSPIYMYYFKYRGLNSRSVGRSGSRKNFGAAHGDDASYIFSMNLDTRSDERDRKISELMIDMWLSFAHKGQPNLPSVNWVPTYNSSRKVRYLKISSLEDISMDESEDLGHGKFWNSLPIQENEKLPID